MTAVERRDALKEVLCVRRMDTVANLAMEFGVSTKTILRDIEALSCTFPIEAVRGRHGGVRVLDWYHPNRSKLSAEQLRLLRRIAENLQGEDLVVINSIIAQFAP